VKTPKIEWVARVQDDQQLAFLKILQRCFAKKKFKNKNYLKIEIAILIISY